ncbi:hypothetical protein N657DRAFT_644080 [Parathielavia appendiculata]|uniref:Ammonium transporter AmtB-like domain-containing protein n=1 Tax=Parathielavia appendiculata TaxID=2587402 RepID=A0AAN6U2K5_9PEZI|nr:hypothetical protein N657DRAFT_644080 [Parathielavia appendiculata]
MFLLRPRPPQIRPVPAHPPAPLLAITSLQWFLFGYSLTFSANSSRFLGDLSRGIFTNKLAVPAPASPRIPDLLVAVYQGMFSCVTVALATGAVAERGRILPCVVFIFLWATLGYDPIACGAQQIFHTQNKNCLKNSMSPAPYTTVSFE